MPEARILFVTLGHRKGPELRLPEAPGQDEGRLTSLTASPVPCHGPPSLYCCPLDIPHPPAASCQL